MTDIKLYIACHKNIAIPTAPYIYPVQAGAALTSKRFDNMLADNVGNHISVKNPFYCELTVQYWAWQNQQAAYYGFMQYRRWLSFISFAQPCCSVYLKLTVSALQRHGYDLASIEQLASKYEILLPRGEQTAETVYEKYRDADDHHVEDLDLMMALIRQHTPEYTNAMEQYIHGHTQYYYNMYVMQRDWFHAYCQWLFPLLDRFDAVNNWDKYGGNQNALRVDGYLAERLFGVWYTHQKQVTAVQSLELPYLQFAMGNRKEFCAKWIKNKLFPPSSNRKKLVKRMTKK